MHTVRSHCQCLHLLAAHLAEALNVATIKTVSRAELAAMIKQDVVYVHVYLDDSCWTVDEGRVEQVGVGQGLGVV